MTNVEIKKAYTKTKKALEKRVGKKYTWVMNARQQKLGTATVCVACAMDSVANVASAREWANGKAVADATKTWKAFKRHADEEEATGGNSWNPRFWRDDFAKMGTLEEYTAKAQHAAGESLERAERFLAEHGTQAEIVKVNNDYARQLIAGAEISAFLEAIGGTATIENVSQYSSIYTYIRFHYTPSAE
jgi:hypothetical protein